MTTGIVSGLNLDEFRHRLTAHILRIMAARMEDAARRWVGRAGKVALHNDSIETRVRVCRGNGGNQGFSIRVHGMHEQLGRLRQFDDLADVHHGDSVGDVLHH